MIDSTRSVLVWGKASNAANWNAPGYFHGESIRDPTLLETMEGTITWIQVAFGWCHIAALSSDGEVYTWGSGASCQLGHGKKDCDNKRMPTRVEALRGKRIVKIACGLKYTVALTDTGELRVCGLNHTVFIENRYYDEWCLGFWLLLLRDEVVVDMDQHLSLTADGSLFSSGPLASALDTTKNCESAWK